VLYLSQGFQRRPGGGRGKQENWRRTGLDRVPPPIQDELLIVAERFEM
jgi:hypothetical protein